MDKDSDKRYFLLRAQCIIFLFIVLLFLFTKGFSFFSKQNSYEEISIKALGISENIQYTGLKINEFMQYNKDLSISEDIP